MPVIAWFQHGWGVRCARLLARATPRLPHATSTGHVPWRLSETAHHRHVDDLAPAVHPATLILRLADAQPHDFTDRPHHLNAYAVIAPHNNPPHLHLLIIPLFFFLKDPAPT